MTSWTCIDTDQASEAHPHMQSPKMDIQTSIRNEFAKIFHENKLDILANGITTSLFNSFLNLLSLSL